MIRHTLFRALPAVLLMSAPDAVRASSDLLVPSAPPITAQSDTVTQTIRLLYAKPSDVILMLRQNVPGPVTARSKSGIPTTVRRISHDDVEKTITVTRGAKAVAELQAVLALMDVKPQWLRLLSRIKEISQREKFRRHKANMYPQITPMPPQYTDVKARLVEIRLRDDGTRQEILRDTSSVIVLNNRTARVAIAPSLKNVMTLSLVPRLNGDNSILVTALLETRYFAAGPAPQRFQTSGFTSSVWLKKRSEWKAIREVSLVNDKQLQKEVLMGTKTPNSIYPLYRWEIMASERTNTISP